MTDEELIGYCEIHCETERALFHANDINRMFVLAGEPDPNLTGWYSVHEEMEELCKKARKRMKGQEKKALWKHLEEGL